MPKKKKNNQEQALTELYEASSKLVAPEDVNPTEILRAIAKSALQALEADVVTLYPYDQKSQKFEQPFVVGNILNEDITSRPEGFFSSSAPTSRFAMREEVKSFAGIPLKFGNEILGVLYLNYRTRHFFTKVERAAIEFYANQAAITIKTLKFVQREHYKTLSPQKKQQYYSCFVSHSSKDEDFAHKLYNDLQNNNIRCWFAPVDMRIGDRIRSQIDKEIRQYDKLLLILSNSSIGSQWVEQEVEAALEKERNDQSTVLFPIRLDNSVMNIESGWANYIRNTRNIGDFSNWKEDEAYGKAFDNLLTALRKKRRSKK